MNDGGRIWIENATAFGPAPKVCLCRHDGGRTVFRTVELRMRNVELRNGGAVAVTDPDADGTLILDGLRCSATETAVWTMGRRIPGLRVLVASESVPRHGFWDAGAILVKPRPATGGAIKQMCIRGGMPGTWKPLLRTGN